jgi:hypothetical protein
MRKKFVAVALILSLALFGCSTLKAVNQKICDNMAQAKVYKDKVFAALASARVGYDLVVGMAHLTNVLPSGATIGAGVKTIDSALDTIGKLYYDKLCLTPADVEKAEMAASEAQQAQAKLGIVE